MATFTMIRFHHAYKAFPNGTQALKNICFRDRPKANLFFLTGPSGAGKTTLFKLIAAFDRPDHGCCRSLRRFDRDAIPPTRSRFFAVALASSIKTFDSCAIERCSENVALPPVVRGDSTVAIARRTHEIFDQVGPLYKEDRIAVPAIGRRAAARGDRAGVGAPPRHFDRR